MKFGLSLIILCLLSTTYAQPDRLPHRYTISLKEGSENIERFEEFDRMQQIVKIENLNRTGNIISIQFEENISETEEINWLRKNPSIAFFQPVVSLNFRGCNPNDSLYWSQYNMEIMKFDEAWCYRNQGLSPLGDTLVVAAIDAGFYFEYRDLIPNIFINYLEVPDNGIDDDLNGYVDDYYGLNAQSASMDGDDHSNDTHGTQVISVIGAKGNNRTDITGTNQNIKMLLCSADNSDELLKCYYYFIEMKNNYIKSGGKKGAFIVSSNLSAGFSNSFPIEYPLICEAYDLLGESGILTSVATINDDLDIDIEGDIPGLCPSDYLIVVTNTDRNDEKVEAGFSKINVDIGAAGENIPLINNQGKVSNVSGTSFASPHVAGAISMLYQYCPKITTLNKTDPTAAVILMKKFILNCGDDLPSLKDITTSGKRLNMIKSLACLNSYCQVDTVSTCRFLLKNNLLDEPLEITFHPETFGNYNLVIYNVTGQLIHQDVLVFSPETISRHLIEINAWRSGVYHLVLEGQGFKCSETLIKL